MANTITVEKLYYALKEEIEKGNGKKKLIVRTDDEGNGFRPMFYTVSPTEGNVTQHTLEGEISLEDAVKNYLIIG